MDKTLSQSEIDAMYARAAAAHAIEDAINATQASEASSPTPVAPNEATEIAELAPLYKAIDELTQRLAKLEAAYTERVGQLEKAVADSKANVSESQGSLAGSQELKNINTQLAGIMQNLQATPAYGARTGFKCDKCGSQGTVAITLRCTKCGKDKLWGWWPKK